MHFILIVLKTTEVMLGTVWAFSPPCRHKLYAPKGKCIFTLPLFSVCQFSHGVFTALIFALPHGAKEFYAEKGI